MPSKSNKKLSTSQTTKKKGKDSQLNGKRQRAPSEEPTYIVEAILDKKKNHGIWTYKVKWQGYSEEECTWEPAKHLETVKDMITEFNKKLKNKEVESEGEEEEEKAPIEIKRGRPSKLKASQVKEEEEKAPIEVKRGRPSKLKASEVKEEPKPEKKSTTKKNAGSSPYKKVKTDEPKEDNESVKKASYGHFKLGDKPRRIVHAKKEKDELIFTIEWEQHEDGDVPLNTEMTSLELRKYDKDLLLDFYEERLKFIKPGPKDSGVKSASKASQHKIEKIEEEEVPKDKSHKYEVVNSDDENNGVKSVPKKKKQSDIINLEDSPQEIKEEKLEEEVKEVNRNAVPTQPIEEIEDSEEIEEEHDNKMEEELQKEFEAQNIVDNKGQATFADLGSNVADDIKDLALDSTYKVISTKESLGKQAEIGKTNGHQNEDVVQENKSEPQDLQLESPKEISDQDDDDIVGDDDESSGLENI